MGSISRHRSPRFTVHEAALLAEVTDREARRRIEDEIIVPLAGGRGERLGAREIFFLALCSRMPLPREEWRDIVEIVVHKRSKVGHWFRGEGSIEFRDGPARLSIDETPIRRVLVPRLLEHWRARRRIVSDGKIGGGARTFRGTRIPVAHVTALLERGVPDSEILADLPTLKPADLDAARIELKLGPRPGRPRRIEIRIEPR
jgi:uncharacterized protein (DUF433 family)